MQRIILVWSPSDLETWREGDRAIPLTAEAYIATRRLDAANVLDANLCIGDPHKVDTEATELLNELHETLKSSHFPWLEAYANVIFETKAFQLIAWLTLIRSIQKQFLPMGLEIHAPAIFSNGSAFGEMFIYRLARESFSLAAQVLRREGIVFTTAPPAVPLRPLRAHPFVRRALGKAVSASLSLGVEKLLRPSGFADTSLAPEVDVVLVGQQYGDAFHSAPLAARLAAKYGREFLWVSMRPEPAANMTTEETALIANLNLEQLRFVDSASLLGNATRITKRSILLDLGSAWHVAGLLSSRQSWGVSRTEWFDFLMDPDLCGFASRYQGWENILAKLRPKVLVGLSVLQDMALIRAWARRNDVPFVCFMHGAFYALKYSHDIDADYIGVFGKTLADQLANSKLPQPRRVVPCGAMQFGNKAALSFRKHKEEETKVLSDTVLFLGFFDSLPFCPWSPEDMWKMLRDLHQVCCEHGKTVRVRPHPRYPASCWSPYVEELERQRENTIVISTEPSIAKDLKIAGFVVASGFDGAVLDTLLAGKLLISYLPDGVEHIDYSRLLEEVGGLACGIDQLRSLIFGIVSDSSRRSDLHRTQEQFLRRYVANPEGDPWEMALDLVEEARHK